MPDQLTPRKLYKYVGPAIIPLVLAGGDAVSLRFSLPREFDDPYELFLTIDFAIDPELLAFYIDLVGDVTQWPTSCFSRRPDVVPMWAHYARGLRGAVIELDEECLATRIPGSVFGDVEYRDVADPRVSHLLAFAAGTLKFRHADALRRAAFAEAYFTKTTAWSHEQERRMVVPPGRLVDVGDSLLLNVPQECISSVIAGPRAEPEVRTLLKRRSKELRSRYFELKIGRSSAKPFLVDTEGQPFAFDGDALVPATHSCGSCGEPLTSNEESCTWCRVGEAELLSAASQNPLRILEHYGLLEAYLSGDRHRADGDGEADG